MIIKCQQFHLFNKLFVISDMKCLFSVNVFFCAFILFSIHFLSPKQMPYKNISFAHFSDKSYTRRWCERETKTNTYVPFHMAHTHSPLLNVYKVIENRFAISDNAHLQRRTDEWTNKQTNDRLRLLISNNQNNYVVHFCRICMNATSRRDKDSSNRNWMKWMGADEIKK